MENFTQIIKNLGVTRILVLLIATLVLLGLFSAIIMRANQAPMVILYGGMQAKEASAIVSRLEGMGVKYEVKGSGSVYVPQDKVGELRLAIAGEGLVGASTTGYEIFDKSSFGTTSLVQNINARRALEGELARTIMSMPSVSNARIHLVLPKKKLFSREPINPSASVTLNLGNRLLSDDQVQSVTHLVAAAVPNLSPKNVTVVDTKGTLLSSGKRSTANIMSTHAKVRRQVEVEYENSITRMLEKIVGPNKASVKVSAEMNFDRVEENSELYDPEKQVVRSEQRSESNSNSKSSSANNAVGAASNIPGQEGGSAATGSEENQNQADETINYEISKTIRNYVREGGIVQRLSVAVLVEGKHVAAEGEDGYIPYSKQEINKFRRLVQSSIGYDEDRGDVVEIIDMAFNQQVSGELEEAPMFSKEDYFRIAESVLMVIGVLILIFFIIRPILKSAAASANLTAASSLDMVVAADGQAIPVNAVAAADSAPGAKPGDAGFVAALGADGQPLTTPNVSGVSGSAMPTEDSMINLDKVSGQVKESSIKKVVEIIDQFPEESVSVIRSWMSGEDIGE